MIYARFTVKLLLPLFINYFQSIPPADRPRARQNISLPLLFKGPSGPPLPGGPGGTCRVNLGPLGQQGGGVR